MMGEHCHSTVLSLDDHNTPEMMSVGMGRYTRDCFVCGLCGSKTSDIEHYVSHMMLTEHCVLHLCPSTAISDLMLPRFSKKSKRVDGEDVDTKHATDLIAVFDKGSIVAVNDTYDTKEVVVPASEVETGGGQRWKCHLCGLTFSRQAAILNHFKLQHSEPTTTSEEKAAASEAPPSDPPVPEYHQHHHHSVKRESVPLDPLPPVKHILAMESKPVVSQMDGSAVDDRWSKLACHICGQIFKTTKIVRAHIATVHGGSGGRKFPCDYHGCSYTFNTKGSLIRHQRRHTGERPFACSDCGRRFRESGSLSRHQRARGQCVNKTDAQIPRYGTSLPLSSHMPPDRKPALSEPKVGVVQLKQEALGSHTEEMRDWIHQQDHKGSGARVCVKTEPSQCQAGMTPPGPPSPLLVACKIESPPSSSSLLMPLPEEEEVDNALEIPEMSDAEDQKPPPPRDSLDLPDILRRSFICPVCSQTYARRSTLTTHINSHLDQLGGQCSECSKSFSTRWSLSRHLASHSSLRQYQCGVCTKTFKLPSHATQHLANHHSTQHHPPRPPVPCRHCGRLYKSKSARNMHERSHTVSASFCCSECPKSFSTKASLVRHIRTHTGEAPFTCTYCGRGFKEHGTLSRHLKHKMPCARQALVEGESSHTGITLVHHDNKKLKLEDDEDVTEPREGAWPSSPVPSSSSGFDLDHDPDDLTSPPPPPHHHHQGEEGEGQVLLIGQHGIVLDDSAPYIIIGGGPEDSTTTTTTTTLQSLSSFSLISDG